MATHLLGKLILEQLVPWRVSVSISAMEYAGSECLDAGERSRVRSLIWIQSEEGDFDGVGSTITIQWVIRLGHRVITCGYSPLRLGVKALHVQDTGQSCTCTPFERTLK